MNVLTTEHEFSQQISKTSVHQFSVYCAWSKLWVRGNIQLTDELQKRSVQVVIQHHKIHSTLIYLLFSFCSHFSVLEAFLEAHKNICFPFLSNKFVKINSGQWPFIVTGPMQTCALIMLFNQYLDLPHLLCMISAKKCSLTWILTNLSSKFKKSSLLSAQRNLRYLTSTCEYQPLSLNPIPSGTATNIIRLTP